ncbi:MAG: hypothetical protein ACOCRX_02925 [Candidatus Woesearchaeota archaeon]
MDLNVKIIVILIRMEYGIKINKLEELKSINLPKYKYIYFGNEFCERKIPSKSKIKKIFSFCKSKNKIPVFLTPPLTYKGIEKMKSILKELLDNQFEIVINDIGLLNLDILNNKNIKKNLGRLLIKSKKGPEITAGNLNEPPENFRESSLSNKRFIDFFKNYVGRFEIDLPSQGINLPENEKISLYMGNSVISVTRRCPYIDSDKPKEEYNYKIKRCKKECLKYYTVKNTKYYSEPIFVMGNAELLKTKMKVPKELKGKIDRIIIFSKIQKCL